VKRRKVVIEREPTRRSGRVAAMSTGNGDHKPDYKYVLFALAQEEDWLQY
jgi:hypothetical protein